MSFSESILTAATRYAESGIAVFPLEPKKKTPFLTGGFQIATRDTTQIQAWWTKRRAANIGIPCGKVNGFFVMDADKNHHGGEDGEETIRALEKVLGALPDTKAVLTPNGGTHYLFKCPASFDVKNYSSKRADDKNRDIYKGVEIVGLDIRGNGGYIVAPPSVIEKNGGGIAAYEWDAVSFDTDIAELPAAWLEFVKTIESPDTGSTEQTTALEWSGEGFDMIADVLPFIDVAQCNYESWTKVGMALKNLGYSVEVWDKWSSADSTNGSDGKPRYIPGECARKWRTFRTKGEGPSVGGRYLISLAKANGLKTSPPAPVAPFDVVQAAARDRAKVETVHAEPAAQTAPARVLQYRPAGRDLTDAGNAELFAKMNRDRLRYCDALGWLNWTGKHWDLDDHAAARMALDFSKEMLKEAASFFAEATGGGEENPAAKQYLNHAMKLRSANAQRNMIDLAKARLAIKARELDANPEILNTEAGIVDLRTGKTTPHDPKQFCTKLAPVAPSMRGAEKWNSFLDLVTCGDGDLKKYLRRVAGMAIVGKVYEEGIQITVGGGRNGKSTFYGALSKVLGDYAGTIDPDVLVVKKHDSRFELTPLRGKRLIVCSELENGQRLSIKALKRISSKEEINIERKFKDQESVTPTHHTVLHTNVLPIVGDARDNGTWRRLTVIPFNAVMPTGRRDIKAYDDVLVREAGGAILQWMIDGAVEYLAANGSLGELPEIVLKATSQYREGEDWLQPFIDECCIFEQGSTTQAVELYATYQEHAARRGDRYIRKGREFYDALTESFTALGLVCKKPGNKVTWYGVRVRVVPSAYMTPTTTDDYNEAY